MIQLTDNIWAYPIPDEAIEVTVYQFKHSGRSIPYWHINWDYPNGHPYTSSGACFFYNMLGGKKKYPSTLKFLFTTKEATWEQAELVVEHTKINGWFKNYEGDINYSNPVDSLQSLLKAKGCDVNKNYAIIQKI